MIAENDFSRTCGDLPPLGLESLLTLCCGMEELGGEVGAACLGGGLLYSSNLICC